MTHRPDVADVMLARAQAVNTAQLDDLLEEIDIAMALQGMERVGVYYGVACPRCAVDVIPLADGRCGWCNTELVDPA